MQIKQTALSLWKIKDMENETTISDLELTKGEELYIAWLKGEYKPTFRSTPTRSYTCHRDKGCGYHEDNSPEELNPSLHKAY